MKLVFLSFVLSLLSSSTVFGLDPAAPAPSVFRVRPAPAPASAPVLVPSPSVLRELIGTPSVPSGPTDPVPAPKPSICFSGSTTVHGRKGPVPMDSLAVGDEVLVNVLDSASSDEESLVFQPVYAFGHSSRDAPATFLQIKTTKMEATAGEDAPPLEISAEHMVFIQGKKNPVRADSIKTGDVLLGADIPQGKMVGMTVTDIEITQSAGLYAPFTKDGTVVVNGVKASSYVSLQATAEEFIELSGGVSTGLSQEWASHMATSPLRIICGTEFTKKTSVICQDYDENGMLKYVAYGLKFTRWMEQQHIAFQVLLFVACFTITGSFVVIEHVGYVISLPFLLGVGALALAYIGARSFSFKILFKTK